ncbi:hypothetical protein [Protofrankia symbiont of Coriaria ruscifolia]|uniref:Secreted protein n=1 Tax=Candidatus Protofrankia californiensis TaxID=1839754 RepID=A0A1C3P9F0_9ACTN|nr:hypothetical protein [Protofrankia symbiont of Coriaria ruscifolia]SBW26421.1 hypothetical protein FDG2_4910 [Candidatus Protofrankia californiensis]
MVRINPRGLSASRRRQATILTTLVTAAALTVGLSVVAAPAQAQDLCGQPSSPWSLREQNAGPGARVEVWQQQNTLLVRLANLESNGKTNVFGEAGSTRQGNDLGRTASIGDAPSGSWCSDTGTGYIWGALSWDVNGTHYWRAIACGPNGCVKSQVS